MKKILLLTIATILLTPVSYAKVDRNSAEYLRDKKHFAIINPLAESIAQKVIAKYLKKETGGKYKVEFDGYTLRSMKQGVFKNITITGKDLKIEGVDVPYLKIKSISDYNWVDYRQNPPVMKTDMSYAFEMQLTEKSVNTAMELKEYQKTLDKINNIAYPLFVLKDARIRIRHNKVHIIMDYNFPISPSKKDRTFMVSTNFKVEDNKIRANDIGIDNAYGNLQMNKVSNLVNLLDPLSFTLSLINKKDCNARVENVKIIDNIIHVNGKILVKGEQK